MSVEIYRCYPDPLTGEKPPVETHYFSVVVSDRRGAYVFPEGLISGGLDERRIEMLIREFGTPENVRQWASLLLTNIGYTYVEKLQKTDFDYDDSLDSFQDAVADERAVLNEIFNRNGKNQITVQENKENSQSNSKSPSLSKQAPHSPEGIFAILDDDTNLVTMLYYFTAQGDLKRKNGKWTLLNVDDDALLENGSQIQVQDIFLTLWDLAEETGKIFSGDDLERFVLENAASEGFYAIVDDDYVVMLYSFTPDLELKRMGGEWVLLSHEDDDLLSRALQVGVSEEFISIWDEYGESGEPLEISSLDRMGVLLRFHSSED